ncbi:MAG: hypothetical protein AAFX78_02675 [Cyanobacteria bacterium J06638_20]
MLIEIAQIAAELTGFSVDTMKYVIGFGGGTAVCALGAKFLADLI